MVQFLNSNITLLAKSQAFKETLINEAVRAVSILRLAIVSRTVTTPPGSPASEQIYIVPSGATGAWSGKTNKIAYPTIDDTGAVVGWGFYTPYDNLLVFCAGDNNLLLYSGSAWAVFTPTATLAGTQVANTYYGSDSSNTANWYSFASSVRAAVLTGLSTATATAVAATDSVLVAIGKLQKQITDLSAVVSGLGGTTASEEIPGQLESPSNKTYVLLGNAQYARTINGLYIKTATGTITAALKINGANVTGLGAISVTSTGQNVTATGANTMNAGDRLTLVLSSNSSATDLEFSVRGTR